jgi:hypothetical protein
MAAYCIALLLLLAACTSVTVIGTDNEISVTNKPLSEQKKGPDEPGQSEN